MQDTTKVDAQAESFKPGDHAASLVDVFYPDGTWKRVSRGEIVTVRELLPDGRVLVDNGSDPGVAVNPDQLLNLQIEVNDLIWYAEEKYYELR